MKKIFLLQMSLMMLLAVYAMPSKAMAEIAQGEVFARVVQAVTMDEDPAFKLNFGDIVPDTVDGSVAIAPDGRITAINVSVSGADVSEGRFNITGEPGNPFTILFSQVPIHLSEPSGGTMELNNLVSSPSRADGGTFDADGNAVVSVGATLVVGADQLGGSYTGAYDITVNY